MSDYGFRDYSPAYARFITEDPIRDGENWFSYVGNNPVNWIDPWGLSASDGKGQGNQSKWINNGDGAYTAQESATLWGLQQQTGKNWQSFGYSRNLKNLQPGDIVGVKLGEIKKK